MAAFTDYTSNYLLDWVVGKTTPAAVSTRYLTASDTILPGGTEQMTAMTGSANRVALTAATYFTSAAATHAIASTADITFTASSSGSATVGFVSMWDAITAGNMMSEAAVTSKSLTAGDSLKILSGNLTFTIT
jgi:hypothetical protein